ncbi:MAG: hypothetical protein ACJ74W_01225 [Pyrinomonadaceae bacterium]
MTYQECKDVIYEETMLPDGFLTGIRENRVDEQKFERLCNAIEHLKLLTKGSASCDKLIAACLFEVPWELENTIPHYRNRDEVLARKVSAMADTLRGLIHELLWIGLEDFYENIYDNVGE